MDYLDDQALRRNTGARLVRGRSARSRFRSAVGIAFLSCCLRLLRQDWRDIVGVAALMVVIARRRCTSLRPALIAMGKWSLLVFFIGFLGLAVMAGVPIAFAFSLATARLPADDHLDTAHIVVGRMDEGMSSLILLAVPLFVLLGQLVRGHRDGAGDGGLPGFAAGPRSGRHVLRAARRDAACLRDLRLEDRRHGGGCAGAVSRRCASAA